MDFKIGTGDGECDQVNTTNDCEPDDNMSNDDDDADRDLNDDNDKDDDDDDDDAEAALTGGDVPVCTTCRHRTALCRRRKVLRVRSACLE